MVPSSSTVSFLESPSASKSTFCLFSKVSDDNDVDSFTVLGLVVVLGFLTFTFRLGAGASLKLKQKHNFFMTRIFSIT